jgi:hypothetical protein
VLNAALFLGRREGQLRAAPGPPHVQPARARLAADRRQEHGASATYARRSKQDTGCLNDMIQTVNRTEASCKGLEAQCADARFDMSVDQVAVVLQCLWLDLQRMRHDTQIKSGRLLIPKA